MFVLPARSPWSKHMSSAKLVNSNSQLGHVPDPPGIPVPAGPRVEPVMMLQTSSTCKVSQSVFYVVPVVVGEVMIVNNHSCWPIVQKPCKMKNDFVFTFFSGGICKKPSNTV